MTLTGILSRIFFKLLRITRCWSNCRFRHGVPL